MATTAVMSSHCLGSARVQGVHSVAEKGSASVSSSMQPLGSKLRGAFLNGGHALVSSQLNKRGSVKSTKLAASASQATEAQSEVEALSKKFGKPGVSIDQGLGGLPRVVLSHESGSVADLYLYGACVTSWRTPSGDDILFVRPDAVFTGAKPISGGIPHCFPQFGPGEMQQHGFARNLNWEIVGTSSAPSVDLRLTASDYTRKMWDFSFEAVYTVKLAKGELWAQLAVTNTDSKPFTFTAALHTYFRAAIGAVTVKGLKGCESLNKDPDPVNPIKGSEIRDFVTFPGFVDCMYKKTPSELILNNGLGDSVSILNNGWPDAVVWNPHLTMEACYKDFVCVENAQLDPAEVLPGKTWTSEMTLATL
eukprot:TRINITY_DN20134_c0_g1_i1.p1 TRINITY_DN20134_c0_g1~~TRINITY_DN20134_c0_g1_i1.p1  ORF type:complete len:364 (-),score=66.70 TRINITY_DN20134_c0_g1_i1:433-1524(-)